VLHLGVVCDLCIERIPGPWYWCVYCAKDLCGAHEEFDTHDPTHVFVVFKSEVDMTAFKYVTRTVGAPRQAHAYQIDVSRSPSRARTSRRLFHTLFTLPRKYVPLILCVSEVYSLTIHGLFYDISDTNKSKSAASVASLS
jgi:hypothetical protein